MAGQEKNVLVEVDSSVGELAEGAALLDLGSLLSVLEAKKGQHFVLGTVVSTTVLCLAGDV